MKLLITLCLVLSPTLVVAGVFDSLSVRNMYSDLKGVCVGGGALIAYGTYGVYMRSTDEGQHWTQYSIPEFNASIQRMRYSNGRFLALTSSGAWLESSDAGSHWIQHQLIKDEICLDFALSSTQIFILTQQSLLTYNTSFNLLKTVAIDVSNESSELLYWSNTVITNAANGVVNMYDLNNGYQRSSSDLSTAAQCDTCGITSQLRVFNGTLYAILNAAIYRTQDSGRTWQQVIKGAETYAFDMDSLLSINVELADIVSLRLKPQFSITGPLTKAISISVVSVDTLSSFFSVLDFADIAVLSNNVVIAVGRNKTILRSTDRGRHWTTISNMENIGANWTNRNLGYTDDQSRIYTTQTGGTTWQPQLTGDSLLSKAPGKWSQLIVFDSLFSCQVDDSFLGTLGGAVNFRSSLNGCRTFSSKVLSQLKGNIQNLPMEIGLKLGDQYLLFCAERFSKRLYSDVFVLDSAANITKTIFVDSIQFWSVTRRPNGDLYAYANLNTSNPQKAIIKSIDSAKTWTVVASAGSASSILRSSIVVDDKFVIVSFIPGSNYRSFYTINVFDFSTNTISSPAYTDTSSGMYGIATFKNKILIGNQDFVYVNDDLQHHPERWTKDSSLKGYDLSMSFADDSVLYCYASEVVDGKHTGRSNTWIVSSSPNSSTSVENSNELSGTNINALPSFPNPARGVAHCILSWNTIAEFDTRSAEVYDALGQLVEGDEHISLIQQNEKSGELSWNCGHLVDGVYFIKLTAAGSELLIPVVVIN